MAPAAMSVLRAGPQFEVPPDEAFDLAHFARMTFGDRSLEREILRLFDRQAVLLLERMQGGDGAGVGALAHTLKGSAAGIGAVGVADAAALVEQAATASDCADAIEKLARAVSTARAAIARMLAG